jgi:hypothetical protein
MRHWVLKERGIRPEQARFSACITPDFEMCWEVCGHGDTAAAARAALRATLTDWIEKLNVVVEELRGTDHDQDL